MEESQAVELLKKGNMSGLEPLVQKFYFKAVRASFLIVQDTGQAEDIVQTAYLHASAKIHQLSSDRFGPWFMRMVINASLKVAQEQKRQVSIDDQDEGNENELVQWLIDPHASVEALVETEELRREIWNALVQLNARQRASVVMRYYLEMSETEISRVLHEPLSTIKWLLFAARQKLRGLLRFLNSLTEPGPDEPIEVNEALQGKEYENERKKS